MRVEKTFTSFTGQVNVGFLAYFIKVGKVGVHTEIDSLLQTVLHFPKVVIYGSPFLEKVEIAKLIKKATRRKPELLFQIDCKSNIRPVGIGNFNVKYNVNVPLKKTGGAFEKRVDSNAVRYFIEMDANFIFDVGNEDDVDEVNMLLGMTGVPKRLVYLSPETGELLDFVIKQGIKHRFNIAPNFQRFLWRSVGKEEKEKDKR